jgi:hypothetical protein
MSATVEGARPSLQSSPTRPRRSVPIMWWATLGVIQLTLAVYCLIAWGAAGEMTPTDPGPDAMPGWKTACMWILSVGGILATGYCLWRFLLQPWIRERRLTSDGMLLIACFAMAVPHDIMLSYTSPSFTYNSHYLNAGSWMSQVPGVQTPNAHLIPEPLVLVLPAYGWAVFLAAMLGCAVMQRIRTRRPETSNAGLVGLTLCFFLVLEVCFETILVHIDAEAYTGAIHDLTLWAGSDNQLPLYEILFWAVFWTGMAAFRFFKDDRGYTFAERGADQLRLSPAKVTAVRQLALIGGGFAAITVLYNVPWMLTSSHNDSFPQDLPSYFVNGVCSPDPAEATAGLPPCPNSAASNFRVTP